MQLTRQQMFGIAIVVLSVLIGSTAQLTDLFGSGVAKIVISFATIGYKVYGVATMNPVNTLRDE